MQKFYFADEQQMPILFFEKATTSLGLSWHLGDIRQGLWWRRGPWLLLETQQRPRLRPGPHGQGVFWKARVVGGRRHWLLAKRPGKRQEQPGIFGLL